MKGPTHAIAGADAWLGICVLAHPGPAVALIGSLIAATAAPWCDADNLGTWSRRSPGWFIDWRTHPVKFRVAKFLSVFGTHRRGPCHSLVVAPWAVGAAILAPAAWWAWWPLWASAAAAAGVASHLLLDLLNTRPVMILWPARRLVYGLPRRARIKVGSDGEKMVAVFLGLLCGLLALVIASHA